MNPLLEHKYTLEDDWMLNILSGLFVITLRYHDMEILSTLLDLCVFHQKGASDLSDHFVEQTVELPVTWDALIVILM